MPVRMERIFAVPRVPTTRTITGFEFHWASLSGDHTSGAPDVDSTSGSFLPCQGSPQPIQTAAFNLSLGKYGQIRYSSVKVLLTVSPLRPSFSPQPCVYPHRSTPRFALSTTHHPLPTFPRRSHARTLSGFSYNYELPLLPHRFARPLFSYNYELLFSQPLCFDKHLRCPIVFSALPRNSASSANSVVKKSLTPFLTYCCELFVVAKNIKSFGIKQIRTLSAKHPGWGIPSGKTGTGVPCPYGRKAVGTGQDLRVL